MLRELLTIDDSGDAKINPVSGFNGSFSETLRTSLAVDCLPVLTRERIYEPVIDYLYKEFENRKIIQFLQHTLLQFPPEMQPVVVQTLVTHVTKEKPVFVYLFSKPFIEDPNIVCETAANVDLLWALSMMIDDIIDSDQQRAGKPTSWVVFGREFTEQTVNVGLEIVGAIMEDRMPGIGISLLKEHVARGLASLKAPELSNLDSTSEDLIDNIDRRASFHCELPMSFLGHFSNTEGVSNLMLATEALYATNRAGQILNDLKDVVPSDIYGRQLFSDIKSGVLTVPLSIMLQELSAFEMRNFSEIFGKGNLTETEVNYIEHLILDKLNVDAVLEIVFSTYDLFLERAKALIYPGDLMAFDIWVQYKHSQAYKLAGGIK